MTELIVGKYKFYQYEIDGRKTETLNGLKALLRQAKAKSKRDVKTPSKSVDKLKPRRERRDYRKPIGK
jgi:hypothetical protein